MSAKEVILILQIGSLGDTVISLPCYREIERRHPDAQRYLLTNYPVSKRWVPAEAILKPTGVIAGCIEYPMPLRSLSQISALHRRIRELRPSALYYLLPEYRFANVLRHYAFFKACGIRRVYGLPWTRDARVPRAHISKTVWESEASRLLRAIGAETRPVPDADRDLMLSDQEFARADELLGTFREAKRLVAVSVGGKVPVNDWGDENWKAMLTHLAARDRSIGMVFVGSADERARNDGLAAHWEGESLNSSGLLTPRESAALIARTNTFIGHDTGTLHLAAAVVTPIVGVYSARNMPGKWFSDRSQDIFFYKNVPCAGCELEEATACKNGRVCIMGHSPAEVAAAVIRQLRNSRSQR